MAQLSGLSGKYYHQLDGKNRIRVPARLKKDLGDEYYFVKGDNHCIYIYTADELSKLIDKTTEAPLGDLEKQKYIRAFMQSILPAAEDNQGRVVLTPDLREHLAFEKNEKDIIVIGAGKRAEIWAKSNHTNYFADVVNDFNKVITNLGV